ncbi:uncharacterized protein LOC142341478 isoform X2 [Convolutriloba macropyga]|uniref:uncharacterized protein LOC142341478 isoform X2 n=1 Tax=Convolutriloba macropyga TaxID=536237 RepID=UPI003F51F467
MKKSTEGKQIKSLSKSSSLPENTLENVSAVMAAARKSQQLPKYPILAEHVPSLTHNRNGSTQSSGGESIASGRKMSLRPGHHVKHSWDSTNGVESAAEFDVDENSTFEVVSEDSKAGRAFLKQFPDFVELPIDHANFSCSLVKDTVPMHGRMYLTPSYVCFVSKLFKKKYAIKFDEILSITKEKSAFVVPNAIKIISQTQKFTFGSLFHRHTTYKLLTILLGRSNSKKGSVDIDRLSVHSMPSRREELGNKTDNDTSLGTTTSNVDSSYIDSEELSNNDDINNPDADVCHNSETLKEKDFRSMLHPEDGMDKSGTTSVQGPVIQNGLSTGAYQLTDTVRYRPVSAASNKSTTDPEQMIIASCRSFDKTQSSGALVGRGVAREEPTTTATTTTAASVVDDNNNQFRHITSSCKSEESSVPVVRLQHSSPRKSRVPNRSPSKLRDESAPSQKEAIIEKVVTVHSCKRCDNGSDYVGSSVLDPFIYLLIILLLFLTTISAYLTYDLYKIHLDRLELDQTMYNYLSSVESGDFGDTLVSEQFDSLNLREKVQLMLSHSCAISQANYQKFAHSISANNHLLSNIQLSLDAAFAQVSKQANITQLLTAFASQSSEESS